MYKLDDIEEDNKDSSKEKESITFKIFVKSLVDEAKDFRKHFCWDKFAEGLVFRFILPLYDIISDFMLASTLNSDEYNSDPFVSQFCTFFCYYCITLPGLMFQARNCKRMLPKKFVKLSNFTLTLMTCFLFFVVYPNAPPNILMPVAIVISVVLLVIGLLRYFIISHIYDNMHDNIVIHHQKQLFNKH